MSALTPNNTAKWAAAYIEKYGFSVVPLGVRSKKPVKDNWGNDVISNKDDAIRYFKKNTGSNIGLALGPSRVCSWDIDDEPASRLICEEFGFDIDAMLSATPTIQGMAPGFRMMFRVPDGVHLPYHALTWPNKDDPSGEKYRTMMAEAKALEDAGEKDLHEAKLLEAKKYARFTVFELRAACDGQQRQDVLPPSIHPDTGQPYEWITLPKGSLPNPPDWLITIWKQWDKFKPQLQDVCPWAEKKNVELKPVRSTPAPSGGVSVIDAYVSATDILTNLKQYGYKPAGKRWLSPHSSTKLPGVNIFPDGRAWIHHASDPLCSDESGKPVNSFDLFCYYEHNGDMTKAVRAAAKLLGMDQAPRQRPVARQSAPEVIDPDTGEITEYAPRSSAVMSPIDMHAELPDTTDRGKILETIENVSEICRRLNVTVRYNVISKEEEILIPNESFSIDNKANASFAWLTSWCGRLRMPTGKLGDFVTYLADQNLYNPVVQWIESKPWDGRSRLNELYSTIRATGEADDTSVSFIKETLIKRWLISAVAAAYEPNGVSAHGVLVLQGGQYLGKTKWFKSLVPEHLGVIQDGMTLRPDDKDSVKQVCSFWLVELGELDATFRKSDIAALKAFLTRKQDVLRRAYARKESFFARRTVFFASVNPQKFLHDPTGNRRYWTISCEHIDHSHNIDMQQVWAEVHALYEAGESYFLTHDEMQLLNDHNEDFNVVDPIKERIISKLDWDAPKTLWKWMTATDVLHTIGIDRPTQSEAIKAGECLRKKNGDLSRKSNGNSLLSVPPIKLH